MKNNNIRYEIRIIGVTKQYNLVFPIKFKNMMHKEFESSVCMCREDNGLGIFKSFSKKYSSVQQVEDYIKDHPNVFQIIYRRETSVNGKIHCGPFHVYHSCK